VTYNSVRHDAILDSPGPRGFERRAAAALAAGLPPIADGSDFAGSLRNPASFNSIVALRPTVGLVPMAPDHSPGSRSWADGRSVADVALLLGDGRRRRAIRRWPSSWRHSGARSTAPSPGRVAWCPDLGGLPLERRACDPRCAAQCSAARCTLEDAYRSVRRRDLFLTLRAWRSWNVLDRCSTSIGPRSPEAIGEIEAGAKVTLPTSPAPAAHATCSNACAGSSSATSSSSAR
jgi:amidase